MGADMSFAFISSKAYRHASSKLNSVSFSNKLRNGFAILKKSFFYESSVKSSWSKKLLTPFTVVGGGSFLAFS